MRKVNLFIVFAAFSLFTISTSCNDSSTTKTSTTKVTELSATTSNKEAAASFEQGLKLYDQGDGLAARKLFAKAVEQDSTLAIAHIFLALSSVTAKEFNDELAKAKPHLAKASSWEKNYYDFVETYNTGNSEQRLASLKKIADEYPDAARAHVDLGVEYESQNDYAKAREHFQKALDLDAKSVGALGAMANSFVFSTPKDFKKAEDFAGKALAVNPQSAGMQVLLGDVYRAQNDLEKARASYAKAIELAPDQPNPYYKRGHVNSFLGNMEEARKDYAQAGKLDQSPGLALLHTSYTYLYAGDAKAGINFLMAEAGRLDTSEANENLKNQLKLNAAENAAMIAFHVGDAGLMQQAIAKVEPAALKLGEEVGTEEARLQEKARVLFLQALLEGVKGNYAAAEAKNEEMKKTQETLKDANKMQNYEVVEGYLALKQKKAADAVTHFEKGDPFNVYHRYWLAKAHEAAGDSVKAKNIFSEIAIYNFNNLGYALVRKELQK